MNMWFWVHNYWCIAHIYFPVCVMILLCLIWYSRLSPSSSTHSVAGASRASFRSRTHWDHAICALLRCYWGSPRCLRVRLHIWGSSRKQWWYVTSLHFYTMCLMNNCLSEGRTVHIVHNIQRDPLHSNTTQQEWMLMVWTRRTVLLSHTYRVIFGFVSTFYSSCFANGRTFTPVNRVYSKLKNH